MSAPASILAFGFSTFFCCLCLHVLLWRLRHPHHHVGALLSVFFIPGAVLIGLIALGCRQLTLADLAAIAILHTALSCAYIQIYPASQADSPSLKILVLVGRSETGLTAEEIRSFFDPKTLFSDRIHDLLNAKLIYQSGEKLALSSKGEKMIAPFLMLRKALGLPAGRG